MKIKLHVIRIVFLSFFYFSMLSVAAQVGIGTTQPDASSLLDINDASGNKGLLIPRVALTALNLSSPIIPAPAISLLVYNTATSGTFPNAVSPGYYYWNGTNWVAFLGSAKWDLLGNSGTDQTTNFLGTIDNQGLSFRTNNIERFRIATTFQVLAMSNGSATLPFYSWNGDNDNGMYRIGTNSFGFSTNKIERFRLNSAEAVLNETGIPYNLRVESDNQENMLFVNGSTDKIGINTNDPQAELHIAGNTATLRIEELSNANNINNVAADPAPVYVNNDGDLTLQPPLIQTFMPVNNLNFLPAAVTISSATGDAVTASLFNTSINLTQESLVHITYQFSVKITMSDGVSPIVDGASRLYRSFVSVDGSSNYIAVDTGTYTNNPDAASPGGTYASGNYYLSGNGYIQLPAGNHTINLSALGFGGGNNGNFGYRMTFGETAIERFQVVVHR